MLLLWQIGDVSLLQGEQKGKECHANANFVFKLH